MNKPQRTWCLAPHSPIPEDVKEQLKKRFLKHVDKNEIPTELCRLGFLGAIDKWEYAFFVYSNERYVPSLVASGSFQVTPEQAFDSSARVHLRARESK